MSEGADADQANADEAGGDPACWIDRVCRECGLFLEDRSAPTCPRCGTAIETG